MMGSVMNGRSWLIIELKVRSVVFFVFWWPRLVSV